MSARAVDESGGLVRPLQRLADGVCRRAFSSPEAFLYELTIAPALAAAVETTICGRVSGSHILDVGCGGGQLATSTARSASATTTGIDPSRSQIMRLARRRSTGAAVFAVQARAEDLPFADGSFDSLYSSCAWKHWPDAAAGLAECVRVTRPGGAILVIEINGASTEAEFRQFAKTSRVPVGLREAYVRFAMRTVVGVAPNADALAHSFRGLNTSTPTVSSIDGTPFLAAVASAL